MSAGSLQNSKRDSRTTSRSSGFAECSKIRKWTLVKKTSRGTFKWFRIVWNRLKIILMVKLRITKSLLVLQLNKCVHKPFCRIPISTQMILSGVRVFRTKLTDSCVQGPKIRKIDARNFEKSDFFRFLFFGFSSWKYDQFFMENPIFRSKLSNSGV